MTTRSQVQHPYGTAAEIAAYTGVAREIIIDTTNWRAFLMDGVTVGGKPLASETYVQAQVAAVSGGSGGGGGFAQWATCT